MAKSEPALETRRGGYGPPPAAQTMAVICTCDELGEG